MDVNVNKTRYGYQVTRVNRLVRLEFYPLTDLLDFPVLY